jgi:hypothetical protein
MTNRPLAAIVLSVLVNGFVGCSASVSAPTATAQLQATPYATDIANVTLSVVVYEMTPTGRVPLSSVRVYASEWASGATDANGLPD